MAVAYKSFCWVMGTTSFRTSQLNRKIELQLRFLDEFWMQPVNAGQSWAANDQLQTRYYRMLKDKGFVVGDAPRPEKDAREKTSGLVELGLVDSGRNLTAVGRKVLAVSQAGDFSPDGSNLLELSKDSYQYFLQLLKATKKTDVGFVRPFIVLLSVLSRIEPDSTGARYLTQKEFDLLLPLCMNESAMRTVVDSINDSRRAGKDPEYDAVILSVLLGMENYREALRIFSNAPVVDENLICDVGMNRKSRTYDRPYFALFNALKNLVLGSKTEGNAKAFLSALEKCKKERLWKSYFFRRTVGRRMPGRELLRCLRSDLEIFKTETEVRFREEFFKIWHLLNAKATLNDYADLNRRYFMLSDIVVFNDEKVCVDLLPEVLVSDLAEWLKNQAFAPCECLHEEVALDVLVGRALPSKEELVVRATGRTPDDLRNQGGARSVVIMERQHRFNQMLNARFPRRRIEELLELVENRSNDPVVQAAVTDNADMPTIFEYLVGIAWYYISGKQGDVLSFMNLSLGPDFLPKTHAGGGEADIVWRYESNLPHYDEHALLIEVTLAEKTNQRRMEMEPVPRHLGEYKLEHPTDEHAYCTFVTTNLNLNVIADFRGKRQQIYYDSSDSNKKIEGLKIMPLDTKMLRRLLEKGIDYKRLYELFSESDAMNAAPKEWHEALREKIEN